jgi:hypothetical protein
MDEAQRAVHEALQTLHPPLASIFESGVELDSGDLSSGRTHLLAHVGREVSRHLLRIISEELPANGPPPTPVPTEQDGQSVREAMRFKIASSLGLSPNHDVVRNWYRIHRDFEGRAHVPDAPGHQDSTTVREAFRRLTNLAWARLAPYFSAEDVVTQILARPPRTEDLEALRSLFLRPQLRYRFFSLCHDPAWVGFLREHGFFAHPPVGTAEETTGGRFTPWPEGTALLNICDQAPSLAVEIIKANVTRRNRSPLVWDQVCRVAERIPVEFAPSLVPQIVTALLGVKARVGAVAALRVATVLAPDHPTLALSVAKAMLGLRQVPTVDGDDLYRRVSPPTYELLENVDDYYVEQLLASPIRVIGRVAPLKTYAMLTERLDRAGFLLARAGYDDDALSHHWLSDWRTSLREHDDLRADLAVAADQVATEALAENPELFGSLTAVLDHLNSPIAKRLRLRLMIAAGPRGARDEIDEVIGAVESMAPAHGAREVADLLRRHFSTAGADARHSFLQNLQAGPPAAQVLALIEWNGESPGDPTARGRVVAAWQAQRLRWFRGSLPEDLIPLAHSIGFTAGPVAPERQDLDEVGHSSSGFTWGGDKGPKDLEELRAMEPEELIELLLTWEPEAGERFDGPSVRGMTESLKQLLAGEYRVAAALLTQLSENVGAIPHYAAAALRGVSTRLGHEGVASLPWRETIDLVRAGLSAVPCTESLALRREAIRVLASMCSCPTLPNSHGEDMVALSDLAVSTSPRWSTFDAREYPNLDALSGGAMNQEAGEVVDLIFAASRLGLVGGDPLDDIAVERLAQWLDATIARTDVSAPAALFRLGAYLPHIIHTLPGWADAKVPKLLEGGMSDPVLHPVWAGYITSGHLYDSTFRVLRPSYFAHSLQFELVQGWEARGGAQGDFRISRSFLVHTGVAILRGLLPLHDATSDSFRRVVELASPADRGHFLWSVMRGLSDEGGELQSGYLERLVEFWEWRLSSLEAAGSAADAVESDALGWLVLIPQLDPRRILDLTVRTLALAPGARRVRRQVWKRVADFVGVNAVKGVGLATALVDAELSDEYPYLDVRELGPALRATLGSGNAEARACAIELIHRIGGSGWSEFRQLLE